MESQEEEVLLSMIKDLDAALDQYLAGSWKASEAMPHILETCQQMRAREVNRAVEYWIGAIEYHAAEVANPHERSGADSHFLASVEYLGIQLLKDIYYLRTQLMNARNSVQ